VLQILASKMVLDMERGTAIGRRHVELLKNKLAVDPMSQNERIILPKN
jgi:hypothetical protein